jgi:hypothetical protein
MITVRYSHFVKNDRKPRRDVISAFYINLANKDNKLYKGLSNESIIIVYFDNKGFKIISKPLFCKTTFKNHIKYIS